MAVDTRSLPPIPLPSGVTSRIVDTSPVGMSYHILEAGDKTKPLILLFHGYPEIAYSWRKMMPLLSEAGYYVVAPDLRGYGRTTGWDVSRSGDFVPLQLVRDAVVLVHALGHRKVRAVCGHDFGAVSAALCALTRPDFFECVVLMSHPWKGSAVLPFNTANTPPAEKKPEEDVHETLAALSEPRKHYKWANCTPDAPKEWNEPASGIHNFLRGYFHLKSADWDGNSPHPLKSWSAPELAKMPYYYILPLHATMREAIEAHMVSEDPSKVASRAARWLPESELDVYTAEYTRIGFNGGLMWYKVQTDPAVVREMDTFAGKQIEIPFLFVSGTKDWGTYQEPGAVENLDKVCAKFRGVRLVDGAGHWVNSEQPEVVAKEVLGLIASL